MKKIICLLSILSLTFLSCNSDDNETVPELERYNTEGNIIEKTVSDNGTSVVTNKYFYEKYWMKLIKIVGSNGMTTTIKYTDLLITEIKIYQNNNLKTTEYYEYDANLRLISRKVLSNTSNYGYKATYVYNNDLNTINNHQTMTVKAYEGDLINQNILVVNRKVFLEVEQAVKIEIYSTVNVNQLVQTNTYEYDGKNSATNSIQGYNRLTFYDLGTSESLQNNTVITYTSPTSGTTGTDRVERTYNSYDFPVTATLINPADSNRPYMKIKYFYK